MISLKEFVYIYQLKPEVLQNLKFTKDITYTANTINLFTAYRGDLYKTLLSSIKTILYDIRKQDRIILIHGEKIYFHTYNVLFHIVRYLEALDFYNSKEYKNTFAGLRGSIDEMSDQYHKHRANIFDSSNAFTGDDRIKAVLFRNFYYDREATDLFVNFYTLYPKNMYKVDQEDAWIKKIIDKIIEHFSSTYLASEEIIYKSLAIVLNAYFRLKMKIPAKHSKHVTEEILKKLFDYTFSASSADLLRNIYISGRLNEIAIFKHAKDPIVLESKTIEKFDSLFNEIKKEIVELDDMPITAEEYFQENPVKQFLSLYPMEFLQEIE